jgi:hypothetical protein
MNQDKLTFQSQNLVVDWIGFNIQGSADIKQIANYLFQNFGFNSIFVSGLGGKQETLFSNSKNKYQVYFTACKYSLGRHQNRFFRE